MNGDRSSNNDSGAMLKKTDLTQNGYGPDYFVLRAGDNSANYFYFYVKAGTIITSIYRTTIDEQVNGLLLGSLNVYPYLTNGSDKFGYGLFKNGDNFTLQITKLHGGLADGIFNGKISGIRYENQGMTQVSLHLKITDGTFSNLKIKN